MVIIHNHVSSFSKMFNKSIVCLFVSFGPSLDLHLSASATRHFSCSQKDLYHARQEIWCPIQCPPRLRRLLVHFYMVVPTLEFIHYTITLLRIFHPSGISTVAPRTGVRVAGRYSLKMVRILGFG